MDNFSLYNDILDSLAVGIFTVDLNWEITSFNNEAERITGFTKEEAVGRKCYEIFRTELCHEGCYLKQAIKSKTKIIKARNRILTKSNIETPVDITVSTLCNDKGRIIGGVESFLDDSVRVSLEKEIKYIYTFEDIIGKDEKIISLFKTLSSVAQTDTPILITGETGTGKDIFARAIHSRSHRNNKAFVKVNCAALPAPLIESELFGYKRGAFTDAKADKLGRFQSAEGGTVLLDEIGDLPIDLQSKLLQVLDEMMFYPLGATRPVKINVRIIATTNKNIKKMVKDGLFREDLYYRLNVMEIEIPPLRERIMDIPLLTDHFLQQYSKNLNKNVKGIAPNAMKILLEYPYPGNVRELKHIIEHAAIVCNNDEIDIYDLPFTFRERKSQIVAGDMKTKGSSDDKNIHKEEDMLLHVLISHGWNHKRAAKALNIHRTTLWRKIKKYGLQRKSVA